jgi:hypothetical protein
MLVHNVAEIVEGPRTRCRRPTQAAGLEHQGDALRRRRGGGEALVWERLGLD